MFIFLTFDTHEQRDVFETIYSSYKHLMLKKAYAILHDQMLAEDAVSEAFIRIYKNLRKIEDPASNRCISFVITIVKNTALTLLKKKRMEYISFEDSALDDYTETQDSFDLEQYVLSEVSHERIYGLLEGIGGELRDVFLLKYAHDLPHKKIGEMLGISENNVTVRLHRAKKKIASLLAKEGLLNEQ